MPSEEYQAKGVKADSRESARYSSGPNSHYRYCRGYFAPRRQRGNSSSSDESS